jgi:hypothetical protein
MHEGVRSPFNLLILRNELSQILLQSLLNAIILTQAKGKASRATNDCVELKYVLAIAIATWDSLPGSDRLGFRFETQHF